MNGDQTSAPTAQPERSVDEVSAASNVDETSNMERTDSGPQLDHRPVLSTDLRRFEGVVWCEGDVQEEDTSLVHGARRSEDGRPPFIDVVSFRTGAAKWKQTKRCYGNQHRG